MVLKKSRDLPVGEYYSLLQLEYVCYRFREMMYSRQEDKKKFSDICIGKKKKIENLSTLNDIPSIFNDEGMRKWCLDKFFSDWGLPNFQYRDDYQKRVKGYWDKFYYYKKGVTLKIKINDSIKLGTVESVDFDNNIVVVNMDNLQTPISFYCISRILSEDFFKKLFE